MDNKKFKKSLLIKLLQEESVFGEEENVRKIITSELDKLGFNYSIDSKGNIAAQRGNSSKYPLLNAHMDIVDMDYHSWGRNDLYDDYYMTDTALDIFCAMGIETMQNIVSCEHCLCECTNKKICSEFYPTYKGEKKIIDWARKYDLLDFFSFNSYTDTSTYKITEKNGKIQGSGKNRVLGGDDKCGIFIALEVARLTNMPMRLLFTVGEECGCVGIKDFIKNNADWFKEIAYSITIDRRGADNLLWSQLGKKSCTRSFAARLAKAGIELGIPVKLEDGNVADVIYIRELVKNAVNISAGYHNPHDTNEYIVWDEVVQIIKWVKKFIEEEKI